MFGVGGIRILQKGRVLDLEVIKVHTDEEEEGKVKL